MSDKSDAAFRTIGEVAESIDLPQHVLRFWETRFKEIEPIKRAGGRRYYRPRDVELLFAIRQLLYGQGYTIKGVQRILREQGARAVIDGARTGRFDSAWPRPAPDAPDRDRPEQDVSDLHRTETAAPQTVLSAQPSEAPDGKIEAIATEHALENRTAPSIDADGRRRLRQALAEISECRRLLSLTRR